MQFVRIRISKPDWCDKAVPDIGGIFSNFAYGGILKHFRSADSQRPLNVGNDLGIETLNVIKFPVSKYESIYRCKRLQHSSSYQVYSAIFTFEYVSYLSRAIAENNPGELFRIGVIAPYRAQADMIDKLLASENLPKEVDVQVGTDDISGGVIRDGQLLNILSHP